jgi:mRNA interferase RelE/StbE
MGYAVVLRPAVQRQLAKLRGPRSVAVHGAMLTLGDEPRPPGAIKLAGRQRLWRVRIRLDGRAWRIVYEIDDSAKVVRVVRIAPRDEGTYRGLKP